MVRRKRRRSFFSLLDFFSLSPLYLAALGLIVAGYGWWQDSPERVHQGLSLTLPAVGCFLLIAVLLTLGGIRKLFHKNDRKKVS